MNLVELANLSVSYEGMTVLTSVNLSIAPHDFLVFTGPNGGGKTTLLRVLAGLQKPQKGTVTRKKGLTIGYLPQNRTIDRSFPITVEEVLLTGLQNRKKWWQRFQSEQHQQCAAMLERLHLTGLGKRPIAALSGGQWQRVLIGRALISNPDILLLDEPEAYLDKEGKAFLYHLLEAQQARSAIVLVSHETNIPLKAVYEIHHQHVVQVSTSAATFSPKELR